MALCDVTIFINLMSTLRKIAYYYLVLFDVALARIIMHLLLLLHHLFYRYYARTNNINSLFIALCTYLCMVLTWIGVNKQLPPDGNSSGTSMLYCDQIRMYM